MKVICKPPAELMDVAVLLLFLKHECEMLVCEDCSQDSKNSVVDAFICVLPSMTSMPWNTTLPIALRR